MVIFSHGDEDQRSDTSFTTTTQLVASGSSIEQKIDNSSYIQSILADFVPLGGSLGGTLGVSLDSSPRVSQTAFLKSEDLTDPEIFDCNDIVDPEDIFPGDEYFFTADGLDCEADIAFETFPENPLSEESSNEEDLLDDNDPSGMVPELNANLTPNQNQAS
ncbi:hypothetical protein BDZ94DRAFT_1315056 [Collybia nuda]|uniref:Uncharacterized protein n=1 Tax=Collybia nuda TaxID=64659 RepID=A0A9P5XRV0_9AGAR|nr:hypothetical protein BDZ94DRAFT_1315056 [Collybia nuda]